jgi:hypothetical protein
MYLRHRGTSAFRRDIPTGWNYANAFRRKTVCDQVGRE